jgi:ankyrin repeat protein
MSVMSVMPVMLANDTANASDTADATDATGATPLIHACKNEHESVVRQLLARDDVDINAVGYDGEWRPKIYLAVPRRALRTPLAAACMGGHTEITNLLLTKEGINVNHSHWH